jgi:hypothetical protein
MSGIAHVVADSAPDDPHTLAVLGLADALRDGEPATVYSAGETRGVAGVEALARFKARDTRLVVYHQRGAAPALVQRLVARGVPLAVVHGDAVPDPIAQCDLRALAAAGATGLATSDAGESRLRDLGYPRTHRVSPVVARDRLAAVVAFAPTTHHLDVMLHGPLVHSVDDGTDAASTARVVQAYHVLRTYLARAGHLAITVPQTPAPDAGALQTVGREIWGLRLADAWLHRPVSAGERAALTRRAAVFVTVDPARGDVRHALAAMGEGVPVVAPADASAAAALGDGALLLPRDAGPALIAEAVADLLNDESRRSRFADAAARATDRYAPAFVAPAWRAALAA